MPRRLTGEEIIASLREIAIYRAAAGGGDTLTIAAIAKGHNTIDVDDSTGFVDEDPAFVIGSGGFELAELDGAPSAISGGSELALRRGLLLPQAVGAQVVEAARAALGHIAEDSFEVRSAGGVNAVPAATSMVPITYIETGGELSFAFGLLGMNIPNLQLAFARPEEESGAGTEEDPYQGVVASTGEIESVGPLAFRGRALRKDGYIVELDLLGCTVIADTTANYSGKTGRPIPVSGRCTSHIVRIWQ